MRDRPEPKRKEAMAAGLVAPPSAVAFPYHTLTVRNLGHQGVPDGTHDPEHDRCQRFRQTWLVRRDAPIIAEHEYSRKHVAWRRGMVS